MNLKYIYLIEIPFLGADTTDNQLKDKNNTGFRSLMCVMIFITANLLGLFF